MEQSEDFAIISIYAYLREGLCNITDRILLLIRSVIFQANAEI
jgi:hypothetical protein